MILLATLAAAVSCACDTFGPEEPIEFWPSCPGFESPASTGDGCGFSSGEIDGLGSCLTQDTQGCQMRSFACDSSERLRAATITPLNCSARGTQSDAGPTAQDCPGLLMRGDPLTRCEGDWVCAQPSVDTCCIEVASCGPRGLLRLQVCSDGCSNLAPNTDLPDATNCRSASEGIMTAAQPCAGSFICAGEQDISAAPISDLSEADTIWWCDGGVVQVAIWLGLGG